MIKIKFSLMKTVNAVRMPLKKYFWNNAEQILFTFDTLYLE